MAPMVKGRRTALITGLVLAGVAMSAALFWPELATRWYLWRLWCEPGYLQKVLDAREGTAAGDAVERFIREPKARYHVFEAYLAEVTEHSEDLERKLRDWSYVEVALLVAPDNQLQYSSMHNNGRGGGLLPYIPLPQPLVIRLRAIQERLASEGNTLTSPNYPYRLFKFFHADYEPDEESLWPALGRWLKSPYCVGFVTNAPPYPEPLRELQRLPVVKRYGAFP